MEGRPGGILGLVALTHDRWDALEADFQEYYRIDLARALWVDLLSARRYRSLVGGLPPAARTWLPETGGWTRMEHLAASQLEWTHVALRAGLSEKSRRQVKPLRIERPGSSRPKPVRPAEFARMLARG